MPLHCCPEVSLTVPELRVYTISPSFLGLHCAGEVVKVSAGWSESLFHHIGTQLKLSTVERVFTRSVNSLVFNWCFFFLLSFALLSTCMCR